MVSRFFLHFLVSCFVSIPTFISLGARGQICKKGPFLIHQNHDHRLNNRTNHDQLPTLSVPWMKKKVQSQRKMRDFIATLLLYQASVFVLFFKVVIFMWVISLDHWGSLVNWGLLKYQKKGERILDMKDMIIHMRWCFCCWKIASFSKISRVFYEKRVFWSCTNTWTFVRVIENIVTMTKMQIGKTHVTGSLLFLTTRQFGKQQVLEETRQESISKGHLWLLLHSVFFSKKQSQQQCTALRSLWQLRRPSQIGRQLQCMY